MMENCQNVRVGKLIKMFIRVHKHIRKHVIYDFRDKRECWTKDGVKASNDTCYNLNKDKVHIMHGCPRLQTREELYNDGQTTGKRCIVNVDIVSDIFFLHRNDFYLSI